MGLPILLKDIIDATPMYTSAGDWALRDSFPENDSGVAKQLKAHGVIVLGKLGLSEWANSFGSQPSGFSNLTGQVLSAIDTAEGPSGSSSGSGAAAAASLAALTIGTETSGSIISPSTQQCDVGLRPTRRPRPGLRHRADRRLPGHRRPDRAHGRRRRDHAAVDRRGPGLGPDGQPGVPGPDGPDYFGSFHRPAQRRQRHPPAPVTERCPTTRRRWTLNFVKGKRIGYNNTTCTPQPTCTPTPSSRPTPPRSPRSTAAGAIMVPDASTTVATLAPLPSGWEAHATIDEYYKGLGPNVPVKNLAQEVAVDNTNPQEATKDGNSAHASESLRRLTITNPCRRPARPDERRRSSTNRCARPPTTRRERDDELPGRGVTTNSTNAAGSPTAPRRPTAAEPGDRDHRLGPEHAAGRLPGDGRPDGLHDHAAPQHRRRRLRRRLRRARHHRRRLRDRAGDEAAQAGGEVDPASYRCARTVPAEPYAARGHCNPDYTSVMSMLGNIKTILPFPLETTSAQSLQAKLSRRHAHLASSW